MTVMQLLWLVSTWPFVFLTVSGMNGNWYWRDKRSWPACAMSAFLGISGLTTLVLTADTVFMR